MRDDEILKVHQELLKKPNIDDKMRKGIDFDITQLRVISAVKNPNPSYVVLEISPKGVKTKIG